MVRFALMGIYPENIPFYIPIAQLFVTAFIIIMVILIIRKLLSSRR